VLKSGAKIDLIFAFAKKILRMMHCYYAASKKKFEIDKGSKGFSVFFAAAIIFHN